MKTFSLLVPSRGRPKQLKKLIWSVITTTDKLRNVFLQVAIDEDDVENYKCVMKETPSLNVSIGPRLDRFTAHYNQLPKKKKSDVIWLLTDDCNIETPGWDRIATSKIEAFEEKYGHSYWYGDTYDSTRYRGHWACFPMISRAVFDTLGFVYNPKYRGESADRELHTTLSQSKAGIIDMQEIKIKHHHITDDETHRQVAENYHREMGGEFDHGPDIRKLNKAIRKAWK